MTRFSFDGWSFDPLTLQAEFHYSFSGTSYQFTEKVRFAPGEIQYDEGLLSRCLVLTHLLLGVSYYKTFPGTSVELNGFAVDQWQANFLNFIYQEGLSQFAFENNLTRENLAHFIPTGIPERATSCNASGVIALQSGGKDSLLVASMLREHNIDFSSLYISSSDNYPNVLDDIGQPVRVIQRIIDHEALDSAKEDSGLNGHVPVTYIVQAIALVQAVLDGKNTILSAIGHEGEEPHGWIDDLAINHQWSKTWQAEQLFSEYVRRYISPDITVGSPIRKYSELKIAELFVQKAWSRFGENFSSCNIANYQQGVNNQELSWCGRCSKCANSYLLFAAFLPPEVLDKRFNTKHLFQEPSLEETFKGLLGVDDVMKPFECVGEVDELRSAYHLALKKGHPSLPFVVPGSTFNHEESYDNRVSIDGL